jgi:hypothetical protein
MPTAPRLLTGTLSLTISMALALVMYRLIEVPHHGRAPTHPLSVGRVGARPSGTRRARGGELPCVPNLRRAL